MDVVATARIRRRQRRRSRRAHRRLAAEVGGRQAGAAIHNAGTDGNRHEARHGLGADGDAALSGVSSGHQALTAGVATRALQTPGGAGTSTWT